MNKNNEKVNRFLQLHFLVHQNDSENVRHLEQVKEAYYKANDDLSKEKEVLREKNKKYRESSN